MPMIRLRPLPSFVFAALFALASATYARPPVQEQMTPEQFKAAGLDKLSSQELTNLNAWLNGKLELETTRAAADAKKQEEEGNRGFSSFGKSDPIIAKIAGEFRGFGKNRTWTLDNGQVWQQTDDATLSGVRKTDPQIRIKPMAFGNAWYMTIEGYNTAATVKRIK